VSKGATTANVPAKKVKLHDKRHGQPSERILEGGGTDGASLKKTVHWKKRSRREQRKGRQISGLRGTFGYL